MALAHRSSTIHHPRADPESGRPDPPDPDATPMDDPEPDIEMTVTDPEMRALLGMFDAPAFARRGADLEYGLALVRTRCARERSGMLEMVRVRLRQWAGVAAGPDDWAPPFDGPVAPLWGPAGLADPPRWAGSPAPPRRRRAVGRDLVASLERFNGRWARFVEGLGLEAVNAMIDQYNRYYLLEKECVLGSRLAARHFAPVEPLTAAALLDEFPPLPVPGLRA
jgi:hypothetical protein